MTHEDYRELIQRELDDDLSSEELQRLETHTAACADCRRERMEYQQLALGLAKLSKVMPERSFISDMKIEWPPAPQPPVVQPNVAQLAEAAGKRRRAIPMWWRTVSVAAVVVLAVGWSTNWQFGLGSHNAPQSGRLAQSPTTGTSTAEGQSPRVPLTKATPDTVAMTTSSGKGESKTLGQANLSGQSLTTTKENDSPGASSTESATDGTSSATDSVVGNVLEPSSGTSSSPGTGPNSGQNSGTSTSVAGSTSSGKGSSYGGQTGTASGGTQTGTSDASQAGGTGQTTPPPVSTPGSGGGMIGHHTGGTPGVPPTGITSFGEPTLGKVSTLDSLLNESVQQSLSSGQSDMSWATDPYQVVQRNLTQLGFSTTATVATTTERDRIAVSQDGSQYLVLLHQPYVQTAQGLWRPVELMKRIDRNALSPYEKPVVDYFNIHLKDEGWLACLNVYLTQTLQERTCSVAVEAERQTADGGMSDDLLSFDCKLKQNADGTWALDGAPIAR